MPRVWHFSELLDITFVPMPSKLGAWIARYEEWIMSIVILAIILLSTGGIYDISIILIACAGYITYILVLYFADKHVRGLSFFDNEKSYQLVRSLVTICLIVIGVIMFPK